jgi:hypothetical protein
VLARWSAASRLGALDDGHAVAVSSHNARRCGPGATGGRRIGLVTFEFQTRLGLVCASSTYRGWIMHQGVQGEAATG